MNEVDKEHEYNNNKKLKNYYRRLTVRTDVQRNTEGFTILFEEPEIWRWNTVKQIRGVTIYKL